MFENLVPQPLHPAVVHLPIALTVLVPIFAVGSLITIKRGARALRAWSVTAALLAALFALCGALALHRRPSDARA